MDPSRDAGTLMVDALAIDRVVRQFEHSHRAGERPDAEALAAQVPDALREMARRRLGEAAARLQREADQQPPVLATQLSPKPTDTRPAGFDPAGLPAAGFPPAAGSSPAAGNSPAAGSPAGGAAAAAGSPGGGCLPQRLGAFEVVRELGRGAFGIVYLAKDPRLDREVAIKVPLLDTPKLRQQYIDEARRAAVIERAGIVPIYHVDVTDSGAPYVVQKFVDGPNLRQLLRHSGPLHLVQSLMIVRDVARALAEAHRLGLVHRDLKPENILIDAGGHPWIADFGLALREDEQGERKGELAGTPMYMAPEQATGQAHWLDGRADIWAVGVLLYELVAGRPPFEATSVEELIQQICHRHPRPLTQRSSAVPPELDEIFQRCCAKEVTARYATADQLADQLQRVIGGLSSPAAGLLPSGTGHPFPGSSDFSGGFSSRPIASTSARSGPKPALRWAAAAAALAALLGGAALLAPPFGTEPVIPEVAEHEANAAVPAPSQGEHEAETARRTSGDTVTEDASDEGTGRTPLPTPESAEASRQPVDPQPLVKTAEQPPPVSPMIDRPAAAPTERPAAAPVLVKVAADGSTGYRTVAAALEAVAEQGTIDIAPGYYSESLVLDKSVTIRGPRDPGQVTLASQRAAVVTVDGAELRIERITLRGLGSSGISEFNTIELLGGSLELHDCVLSAATYNCIKARQGTRLSVDRCALAAASDSAISSVGAASVEIVGSNFRDCAGAAIEVFQGPAAIVGCSVEGTTHYGVYCQQTGTQPVTIRDCQFQGCTQVGVRVAAGGRATVDDSTLVRCRVGLEALGGTSTLKRVEIEEATSACVSAAAGGVVEATDCRLRDSLVGITIAQATLTMRHSTIASMRLRGVHAEPASTLRLESCQIENNAEAGLVVEATTLTLVECAVTGNGEAGILANGAEGQLLLNDTQIRKNHRVGVLLADGKAEIRGGLVAEHSVGVLVQQSAPDVARKQTPQDGTQQAPQDETPGSSAAATLRAEQLEVRDNEVGFEFRAGTKGALIACRTAGHPADRALVTIGSADVNVDAASVFE